MNFRWPALRRDLNLNRVRQPKQIAPPPSIRRFHVDLKLTDPRSGARMLYANVSFTATNVDAGKTMALLLPPMWGSSGLHYSANSALLGDGIYAVTVTVDVPTFQRELKDKDLCSRPAQMDSRTPVRLHELSAGRVLGCGVTRRRPQPACQLRRRRSLPRPGRGASHPLAQAAASSRLSPAPRRRWRSPGA